MRKISKKREKELRAYSDIKETMKGMELRCVFSGIKITGDFDIHHISGERENDHLVDEALLYPALREYHTLYHNSSFIKLIEMDWYREFLLFLKRAHPDLWEKELYKPVKSGDKGWVWYEQMTM